jgi:tight adherence protein B
MPVPASHRLGRLERSPDVHGRRVPWRVFAWPSAVAGPGFCGLALDGGRGAAVGFCAGAVAVTCWTTWLDHRARRSARLRGEQVVSGCLALAGLLRVGHVPAVALRIAAVDAPVLADAAAAQQVGGSVPAALRRLGGDPGGSGLVELAMAWEVSARTGASLTAALDALGNRLEASRKLRRVVDAELSAPRATSRMLAALPLAGLGLGFAFGGDPLAFLLGTAPGQVALSAGVALACAGVWWTERIARAAGG